NDPPYLFHCSHQLYEKGLARMPFPFSPDWIVEALGMREYEQNNNYEVVTTSNRIQLFGPSVSIQGQKVHKVTVFSRGPGASVQVKAHLLRDAAGKDICAAYITEVQRDSASGAIIPRSVELVWPAEHLKVKMKLLDVTVNRPIDESRGRLLFTRPVLK